MPKLGVDSRFGELLAGQFRCAYCGQRAPDVPLEVIRIEGGAATDPDNLAVACRDCGYALLGEIEDLREKYPFVQKVIEAAEVWRAREPGLEGFQRKHPPLPMVPELCRYVEAGLSTDRLMELARTAPDSNSFDTGIWAGTGDGRRRDLR